MNTVEIIRPGETVGLDPAEAAFAHGYGLFETMCVDASKLYFWKAHWQRLSASSRALGIPLDVDPEAVLSAIRSLVIEESRTTRLVVKLSLLREGSSARIFVYLRPAMARPESVGLLLDPVSPVHECALLSGHKTHNYMENRLLMDQAKAACCYDVLRLNTAGHVTEGAISNLFWESGGVLYTPAERTGLLPGVVRAALLDAVDVQEGLYSKSDLMRADAIYLTNSSIGVKHVAWIREGGKKTSFRRADARLATQLSSVFDRAAHSAVCLL